MRISDTITGIGGKNDKNCSSGMACPPVGILQWDKYSLGCEYTIFLTITTSSDIFADTPVHPINNIDGDRYDRVSHFSNNLVFHFDGKPNFIPDHGSGIGHTRL